MNSLVSTCDTQTTITNGLGKRGGMSALSLQLFTLDRVSGSTSHIALEAIVL